MSDNDNDDSLDEITVDPRELHAYLSIADKAEYVTRVVREVYLDGNPRNLDPTTVLESLGKCEREIAAARALASDLAAERRARHANDIAEGFVVTSAPGAALETSERTLTAREREALDVGTFFRPR